MVATAWRRIELADAPVDWAAVGRIIRSVHELDMRDLPPDYPMPSTAALVKEAIQYMRDDAVLLPLLQFPLVGAYRTDKIANTQAELGNYRAVNDWWQWEDVDGDGQLVFGAEQFPDPSCPNPINECANSSWYVWTVSFAALPAPFDATSSNTFEITEMLASEPVVEEL